MAIAALIPSVLYATLPYLAMVVFSPTQRQLYSYYMAKKEQRKIPIYDDIYYPYRTDREGISKTNILKVFAQLCLSLSVSPFAGKTRPNGRWLQRPPRKEQLIRTTINLSGARKLFRVVLAGDRTSRNEIFYHKKGCDFANNSCRIIVIEFNKNFIGFEFFFHPQINNRLLQYRRLVRTSFLYHELQPTIALYGFWLIEISRWYYFNMR